MRRSEFEDVIAAAAAVTGHEQFAVIGRQAILGSVQDPQSSYWESMEADIYPLHDPAGGTQIDGVLGAASRFHQAFGYFAHGAGPQTAKPPHGWQERVVALEIAPRAGAKRAEPVIAYCLERHDLVLSKCVAGRERDWEHAEQALRAGLVEGQILLERAAQLPVDADRAGSIERHLRAIISATAGN
jgi:hypothetical protein